MKILETERLLLRQFELSDAPFIQVLLNTPKFIQHIGNRNIDSIEAAEKHISERLLPSYATNGYGFWLVEVKETGEPIGLCGLTKRPSLDESDIGYAFLPTAEGQGYATEATKGTLDFIEQKLGLPSICAIVSKDNVASIRLLEKIGLNPAGSIMYEGEALSLFRKIIAVA